MQMPRRLNQLRSKEKLIAHLNALKFQAYMLCQKSFAQEATSGPVASESKEKLQGCLIEVDIVARNSLIWLRGFLFGRSPTKKNNMLPLLIAATRSPAILRASSRRLLSGDGHGWTKQGLGSANRDIL